MKFCLLYFLERFIVVLIRTRIRQFVCDRHNEFDNKIAERSSLKQSIVSFEWIIWLFKLNCKIDFGYEYISQKTKI